MIEWFKDHEAVMWGLVALTILTVLASMVAVPIMLLWLPPDYFTHAKRPKSFVDHKRGAMRIVLRVAKNVLGAVLILAGAAMLMLPGQGLLTLLVGFMLIDAPGKYRFEKWLVSRQKIRKSINWLRKKRGREPIQQPSGRGAPEPA